MDRVYDRDQRCFVCGHSPSVGFLYVCRQDCRPVPPAPDSQQGHDQGIVKENAGRSELRRELEEIGLSESVIRTAERGEYNTTQLNKLKALKLDLKQAIEDTLQLKATQAMHAKLMFGPRNYDGAAASVQYKTPPSCNFQACHTCRPYYKDRSYISFEAVLSNNFVPVTPSDAAVLPVKSASKLRFIGLLPNPIVADYDETSGPSANPADLTPSRTSLLTFKTTQTDVEDLSAIRQPRRRFYKLGHRSSADISRDLNNMPIFTRQGLKYAIQGIFRPSRESSSSGSNITLPLARTGTAREFSGGGEIREFDVGSLRRVRRQKERNDLRNGTLTVAFEGVSSGLGPKTEAPANTDGGGENENENDDEDLDSDSDFTVYSRASEGSEVEVDGGVALTEEAVETHVPDMITPKAVEGEKLQAIVDVDECIMAQV
ncbi:hypothetical protein K504DRAFT_471389 [Pleomassaria siparia CBS 279.74]|uniref:Uncharacterized protein n=1 Tax=Pleomassaria siparia CBS 279.74 TaxID=1314801 RepID=A0A6G1JZB7_9PLEO|nr:hypothetical protein K504DRAFT_471389 [Pleomassaria siparia CBS 279.74]